MNISRKSDTDEEDVVGGDSRRNVSASPVMPKLYPVPEPRSADELTPGEELQAVGNERGCSPGDVNCSPMQQAMYGHPPRNVSAQQHGRRREVAVTLYNLKKSWLLYCNSACFSGDGIAEVVLD